ncbi:MAG: UvrD-helicase domain-containing protein [Candidatus Kapabacteria bacterium]|nr:UvrD-helicase domain-containing protein [Candidatus Kapabacteria bacterium]
MLESIYIGIIIIIGTIIFNMYSVRSSKRLFPLIEQAEEKISSYLEFPNGYFNLNKLTVWRIDYDSVLRKQLFFKLKSLFFKSSVKQKLYRIWEINSNAETIRNDYNRRFIDYELKVYDSFFDNVEGRKLDKQQREAVITDEDNNLVVAGAGSGKTTTIVGKMNYIIDRYKAKPEEILLISFTNKSSKTLADRINIPGVRALTFHKFGLDTITEVEKVKPSLFDEKNFKKIIIESFNQNLTQKIYLEKVVDYFLNHLKIDKSLFDFKNQGEHFQYLKDMDYKAFIPSTVPNKGKQTYNYEIVKSIQECKIANFLFFNRVFYYYERPYPYDTSTSEHSQYRPDFTIVKDITKIEGDEIREPNSSLVFLEHFGIDRQNNVPKFFAEPGEPYEFAKKKYLDKIDWARKLHKRNRTELIETFSYEFDERTISENLTKKLQKIGIKLDPMSSEEIWNIINTATPKDIDNFYDLIATFIVLMKSNNMTISDVKVKASMLNNIRLKERSLLFLELIEPIYLHYEKSLKINKQIDFSDMINISTAYFSEGKHSQSFKYIIIDEFQDISLSRYRLIKSLKDNNPDCKLFCVGDDWQSIYRFTGSDIGLFRDFSKYFGFTALSKIETTYRFSNPLLKLSNEFIMKNPNQTLKQLMNSNKSKVTNYKIIQDKFLDKGLIKAFDDILENISDVSSKEIILLGRYKFDFIRLKQDSKEFKFSNDNTLYYNSKNHKSKTLKADFMTVHSAKGLEADIILLINCKSGQYGFPSQISDDPVLNLLLSDADQFENSEERRLFYVALTRAKEYVYLIAPEYETSKFIDEIDNSQNNLNGQQTKLCPKCETTKLKFVSGTSKTGNDWAFWGCSNFRFGCDYKEWVDVKPATPIKNRFFSNRQIK